MVTLVRRFLIRVPSMKYIESVLCGSDGTPTAVTRRARDVDLQFTSGLPKTTAPRGIREALEVSRHSFMHFAHSPRYGKTDSE